MAQKNSTKKAQLIDDLRTQLEAATQAQSDKLAGSKKHLIAQLEMASRKYLTVNGYMQARSTLEQVLFGKVTENDPDDVARDLAQELSRMADEIAQRVEAIDVMDLDEAVLDGYLIEDFVTRPCAPIAVARQLLVVNLLQNIGPVIDDIIQFRTSTNEAVDRIQEEITKATGSPVSMVEDAN